MKSSPSLKMESNWSEFCRAEPPDLIITDLRMEEMNGVEALEEIHKTDPIPAIIISGYHNPEEILGQIDKDLVVYLVKPVKLAELAQAIEHF